MGGRILYVVDKILLKKYAKYIVPISVILFLFGILFDHYILMPFFSIDDDSECKCGVQSNIGLDENILGTSLDKKLEMADVDSSCDVYIDVSGAVEEPGVYCLDGEALLIDAINKAGGFTGDVAYRFVSRKINLAQPVSANQKVYIPFEDELECTAISLLPVADKVEIIVGDTSGLVDSTISDFWNTSSTSSSSAQSASTSDKSTSCININSASADELTTLNGVGNSTATKIIEGRPYTTVDDLLNVSGIGEATLEKFKEYICV